VKPLITDDFRRQVAILRHFEKLRLQTQNRHWSLTEFPRKKDYGMHLPPDHPDVLFLTEQLSVVTRHLSEVEASVVHQFTTLNPLHEWARQYRGMGGGKLLARFLGEVGDPYLRVLPDGEVACRKFSQLKSLCGRSVTADGKMPHHERGQQSTYRSQARVRLWNITHQFMLMGEFRPEYERAKAKYLAKTPLKPDGSFPPGGKAIAERRARVLLEVHFLRLLYNEARRLHTEEGY
jgi:hypothetical protein